MRNIINKEKSQEKRSKQIKKKMFQNIIVLVIIALSFSLSNGIYIFNAF